MEKSSILKITDWNIQKALERINIDRPATTHLAILLFAFCIGSAFKFSFILSSNFPLNDGGLFLTMIHDLQRNHFLIPPFATYNQGNIPFVYPPLALYLAGLIDKFTPLTAIDILRFLPLIFNILTGVAVYYLAAVLKLPKTGAAFATGAFLLLPDSSSWLIMGGGLTRSPGLFFTVLTLIFVYRLYESGGSRNFILASISAAGVCLTHLEMAWLALFSCLLLFLFYGRTWVKLRTSLALALVVLGVTSPWWLFILRSHGIDPFINAIQGIRFDFPMGSGILDLVTFPSHETLFPLLGSLTLIGTLICIRERSYFLPLWVLAIFILQPRGDLTKATIPFSILIALGITQGLQSFLSSKTKKELTQPRFLWPLLLSFGILFVLASGWMTNYKSLNSITMDDLQAMHWANANSSIDSRFLVIPQRGWSLDSVSEWFPAYAQRVSIETVQGYEFDPNDEFARRLEASNTLRKCYLAGDIQCIETWSHQNQIHFDYLFLPIDQQIEGNGDVEPETVNLRFIASMNDDPNYNLVYKGKGALIYKRYSQLPVSP